MALISLRNVHLAFGGPAILDNISLQINRGDRICLLGRNGTGKSTLLKLIDNELQPDDGVIDRQQGLRIARLAQDVPRDLTGSVYDVVASGLEPGVESAQKIDTVLSRLELDPDAAAATLSGGVLRRLLLAQALVAEPDVLLLDEPTNHLDISTISWLEEFLLRAHITLVFVTHDRSFLKRLANRIVEIDRGFLSDFPCSYETFLRRREEQLHAEEKEWRRFDKKLAEEEIWIRKGIKARRTRNEGRVRSLKKMREERRLRRERLGTSKLSLIDADKSGRLVIEAADISFAYGDNQIIDNFSTTIMRGDRVGIIGPNGAGKSTLLKLLLGQLQPRQGSVKLGTNLETVYFDQLREQLDPDRTVQQNLAGDHDTVLIGDRPKHVIGYLQDFLFTPDRARTPVRILSGGERNRLLLAKLFTRPANLLVLDEPTNDLDLETLDLLEELLSEFRGTLFLVSHDRDFLNRVVTSTIALEGDGRVSENIGGYDDWLNKQPSQPDKPEPTKPARKKPTGQRERKLSFKEKQELTSLPQTIETLESEIEQLHEKMADPDFYREAGDEVATVKNRLEELEADLEHAYDRWQALEAIAPD